MKKGRVNSTLLPSNENMKKILIIFTFLLITSCSNGSAKDTFIECEVSSLLPGYETDSYALRIFDINHEKYKSLDDGKYNVWIDVSYSKGNYSRNYREIVPFIKKDSIFTMEIGGTLEAANYAWSPVYLPLLKKDDGSFLSEEERNALDLSGPWDAKCSIIRVTPQGKYD